MSTSRTALIAWVMCGLSLALAALSLLLMILNIAQPGVPIFEHWIEDTVIAIGLPVVGALVVPRLP